MNKIFLKLIIGFMVCLTGNHSIGQVLTAANLPLNGDQIHLINCDILGVSPGFGGQSVLWDFSGLIPHPNPEYEDYFIDFRDPVGTPYYDQFPEAEICIVSWDSTWAYYVTTSSTLERIGVSLEISLLGRSLIQYVDTETENEYPFSFPMSFEDDFTAGLSSQIFSDSLHGFKTVTADSYGTLKLPYATFQNVLRLVETNTQILNSGIISNRKYFRWYSQDYKFWLLQLGYEDNYLKDVLYTDNPIPAGLNDVSDPYTLQIHPNPVNSYVNIHVRKIDRKIISIAILDIFSNTVKRIENINTATTPDISIDVSDLSSGVYFMVVQAGKKEYRRKLIVQH